MSEKRLTLSWMWPVDNGINALRIDPDRQLMRWYDAIGCACGMEDSAAEQSIGDYLQTGVPSRLDPPPQDVQDEIVTTLTAMAAK